MTAFREMLLLTRLIGAALAMRASSQRIASSRQDLARAAAAYDSAAADLAILRTGEQHPIPQFLLKETE